MLVSLCIIARNEELFLPKLLQEVQKQSYPKELTEIVFVHNFSTDNTRKIMVQFAQDNRNAYKSVCVYDNEKNLQAAAWNTALLNANGDVIIRLDAHSSIPPGFISASVRNIENGEDICGGGRPNRVWKKNSWALMLLAAEESMFGSVAAKYRRVQPQKTYLSSVFHGAYRKEVFAKVGGFNEDLGRTEDNEFHYRVRKAGYKICCCPDILSYQYIRNSLRSMLEQKWANGYWIGLTTGVCRGCISTFHFAPFVLILAYLLCGLLCAFGAVWPLVLLSTVYLLFNLFNTVSAFWGRKVYFSFLLLPVIYPLLHLAYGIGTLWGLLKMPFWKRSLGNEARNRIALVKNKYERQLINEEQA